MLILDENCLATEDALRDFSRGFIKCLTYTIRNNTAISKALFYKNTYPIPCAIIPLYHRLNEKYFCADITDYIEHWKTYNVFPNEEALFDFVDSLSVVVTEGLEVQSTKKINFLLYKNYDQKQPTRYYLGFPIEAVNFIVSPNITEARKTLSHILANKDKLYREIRSILAEKNYPSYYKLGYAYATMYYPNKLDIPHLFRDNLDIQISNYLSCMAALLQNFEQAREKYELYLKIFN